MRARGGRTGCCGRQAWHQGDGGLILTTAEALTEARKEALRAEPKIEIVDRDQLCQMVADLKLGVIVKSADDISVDVNFFQAF